MNNPVDGGWIEFEVLKNAVVSVSKFKPTVLVVSKTVFDRYAYSIADFYGHSQFLKKNLKDCGIGKIIWASYLKDNEFELSSEDSYTIATSKVDGGLETIAIE